MRKLKVILMTVAVMTAVGSTFATHKRQFCEDMPQYIRGGGGYQLVGTFGVDYVCLGGAGICTYYRPSPILQPNTYLPCRYGVYTPVFANGGAPGQTRGSR